MARLATVGFESQVQSTTATQHGENDPGVATATQSGSPTIDQRVVRSGKAALRCAGGAGNYTQIAPAGTVTDRWYWGRAYVLLPAQAPASNTVVLRFRSASADLLSVQWESNALALRDSSGQIGSAFSGLETGRWYRVEVGIFVPSAGNGQAELRIDGQSVASSASVNLGNSAMTNMRVGNVTGGGSSTFLYVDDVAINDDQGTAQNSWPGAGRIILATPDADIVTIGFTDGVGGTQNLHRAVNNTPPLGVAAGSSTVQSQIKSPNNNATDTWIGAIRWAGWLRATDDVSVIQTYARGGNSSTTSRTLAVSSTSNPVIAEDTTTTDATAAAAEPTGWKSFRSGYTYDPALTGLGDNGAAVVSVRKGTASTDVMSYDQVGLMLEYRETVADARWFLLPHTADPVSMKPVEGGAGVFLSPESTEALPVTQLEDGFAETVDTEGGRRVSSRPKNPVPTFRVIVSGNDEDEFQSYLSQWQRCVDDLSRGEGQLVYTTPGGTVVTWDVESARVASAPYDGKLLDAFVQGWEVELECRPFGRLDPLAVVAQATGATPAVVVGTGSGGVPGNTDALASIRVRDRAAQGRKEVHVGVEHPRSNAQIVLDSSELDRTNTNSTTQSDSDSFSPSTTVTQLLAKPGWQDVVKWSDTRTGPWKIIARLKNNATDSAIQARVAWRTGSSRWTFEDPVEVEKIGSGSYVDVVLADVFVPPDRGEFEFKVQAESDTFSSALRLDYIVMMPTYRYATAIGTTNQLGDVAIDAFDAFTTHTIGANLDTLVSPSGDTWDSTFGTGEDAPDFVVDKGGAYRETTTADSSFNVDGRWAMLSGPHTATRMIIEFDAHLGRTDPQDEVHAGARLRCGDLVDDSSTYLDVGVRVRKKSSGGYTRRLYIKKRHSGGGTTDIVDTDLYGGYSGSSVSGALLIEVLADGSYRVFGFPNSKGVYTSATGTDSDLATAGPLETGEAGIYMAANHAGGYARFTYVEISGSVPAAEEVWVVPPSGVVEFDHEQVRAFTSGGAVSGVPSDGSRFRVPPGQSRFVVMARRSETVASGFSDSTEVEVGVVPRVLLMG